VTLRDPDRELPAALVVASERVLAVATSLDQGGAALAHEGRSVLLERVRAVARQEASDLSLDAERSPGWLRIVARTERSHLVAECGSERAIFQPLAPGELEARLRAPRDAALVRVLQGEKPLAALAVPSESALELAPPAR